MAFLNRFLDLVLGKRDSAPDPAPQTVAEPPASLPTRSKTEGLSETRLLAVRTSEQSGLVQKRAPLATTFAQAEPPSPSLSSGPHEQLDANEDCVEAEPQRVTGCAVRGREGPGTRGGAGRLDSPAQSVRTRRIADQLGKGSTAFLDRAATSSAVEQWEAAPKVAPTPLETSTTPLGAPTPETRDGDAEAVSMGPAAAVPAVAVETVQTVQTLVGTPSPVQAALLNLGRQPHDPLLSDLVRLNPTRVRLENAILNGETAGSLPCQTVLEYAHTPDARERFLRCVANFGRQSADQLDELIDRAHRQVLSQNADRTSAGDLVPMSAAEIRNAVGALFGGKGTDDVLARFSLPARFQNGLFLQGWLASPFAEFLADFPARCAALLDQANVGRGSVGAGQEIVRQIVEGELAARGLDPSQTKACLAAILEPGGLTEAQRLAATIGLRRERGRPEGEPSSDMSGANASPDAFIRLSSDSQVVIAVADLFGEATVAELVIPLVPPARLENVLRNNGWLPRPYREMLPDFRAIELEMLTLPNMGRTSLEAWRKIARRLIETRLARRGLSPLSIDEVAALIIRGQPLSRTARDLVAYEFNKGTDGGGAAGEELSAPQAQPPRAPEDLLAPLLSELDERSQLIIARRYGLNGPRETLEEISKTYEVTRERIRQLEHKALRRLRLQTHSLIPPSLELVADEAWRAMADGPLLMLDALGQGRRRLDGWFELALDVAKLSLSEWLDAYAQNAGVGWVAPGYDLGRLEAVRCALRARDEQDRTPIALQSITVDRSGLTIEDLRLAAELEGRRVFGDYVISGHLGSRSRRTVQMHALLGEAGRPVEVVAALKAYVGRWPADPCSARDLEIVMEEYPRLFIEMFEGVWAAIGPHGRAPEGAVPAPGALENDEDLDREARPQTDSEDVTIGETIFAELRRTGPQRISSLIDRAPEYLPAGRSAHSVGPILLSNKDLFARPLPGVYALHDQIPDETRLLKTRPAYLFEERHVRNYVYGRNAGEPFGAYALWTPAAEYLWCHWARRHADTPLLEALLSVANPDAWPEVEDRAEWRELKARRGRYALHVDPRDEAYGLPEIDHVFGACIFIRDRGALNWVAANRIQFRRPADHTAAGLLAFLVAVGALEGGAIHWQASHAPGEALEEVWRSLEDARVRWGMLRWRDDAGERLMARARAYVPRDGWVTADRVRRLVGKAAAPDPGAHVDPPTVDFLDQLLAEQHERHDAARLAGVLAELGVEPGERGS